MGVREKVEVFDYQPGSSQGDFDLLVGYEPCFTKRCILRQSKGCMPIFSLYGKKFFNESCPPLKADGPPQ